MATKIILKKSSVAGNEPTTADIDVGEVALNLADKKLYSRDGNNNIIEIGPTDYQTLPVKADVAITKGTPLYATGAVGNSGVITVNKFIANNTIDELYLIGVAEKDFAIGDVGKAVSFGEIKGINTTGSTVGQTWVNGTVLYASSTTAGALTNVAPTAPNQTIPVAMVINAHATNGILFIRPSNGFHLSELHDVAINSIASGEILKWDGSKWVNNTLAEAGIAAVGHTHDDRYYTESEADTRFVNVTGDTMTGNLTFGDNNKAIFGAGSDLKIYHDGSNSWIKDDGTGSLLLTGSAGVFLRGANNENGVIVLENGAVTLHYDNAAKLATTATGVDVTGSITVSGTVDGRDVAADGAKLDGIEAGATADMTAAEILAAIKTVDGSGSGLDADTLDGIGSGSFLRSDADDTATGNLTFTGNVDHTGTYKGIYHAVVDGRYYFDTYEGSRNTNAFLETQRSDIIRYRDIGAVEYWDGSAWQDASSQLSNVKKLLDGRQDTAWNVPSTYFKFRFTVTAASGWPTMALIGMQTAWVGSTYPGCQMLVEELQTDGSWLTKVTADFTSSNGITTWGTMFRADQALHTGRGNQTHSTRITIDFDGWTPSNPSYEYIPLQNIFIFSNFSGTENNDYKSLLDYDRNINAPNNITVAGTVDGRDIAADGAKLDSIEAGATGDMSAGEILTAIKTVDGAASGLNADLLDGQHGSYYAPIASPSLTGTPTAPTAAAGTNTTQIATTAFVGTAVSNLVASAPATLDTLNELAAALGDDPNFATTVTNNIATKAASSITISAGGGLTGGGNLTANRTISHADTSTQASVNNSNGVVIQDVTLDGYGHVTALGSIDLDSRYYTESESDSRFVNVTGDTMTGDLVTTSGNSNGIHIGTGGANITSVSPSSKDIVIQDVAQIRFGGAAWDWNAWAGIAFNDATEVLTIGGPASGVFSSNASPPDITINFDGLSGQTGLKYENQPIFHDGYHPNADKWTTARTLSLSGDASGSVSWDGSANATLSVTVADDSHNHIISNVDGLQAALDGKQGVDASILQYRGTITSQDWNTFVDGTEAGFYSVTNMTGANIPPTYTYGLMMNASVAGKGKFQLYAPHNGSEGGNGLYYRSGWNTDYDAWAEIWHSNNDGSGSGLDADLLDGQQGSYYTSIGSGQSWTAVTRSSGTVYQNTTGRSIELAASCGGSYASLYVGTNTSVTTRIAYNSASGNGSYEQYHISAVIPSGWYYKLTGAVNEVRELR